MSSGTFENLPVEVVQLDKSNPRISRFLEFHEESSVDDNLIELALNVTPGDNLSSTSDPTTPRRLRESIIANRGIRQPIIVNKREDGSLVCVEGNTRLWIYRDLHKRGAQGDWSRIPALVHESLEHESIDAIRLQAHLVGPRPWDAYSKAKYLHELQNGQLMPLDRIVALCGGNQRDVTRSIQAYQEMEEFYRPLCRPSEFEAERFSGFVEFQNPRIRQAVLEAGFSGADFATWIKDGRIGPLQEVRQLPPVLKSESAKPVFLKEGMKAALKELDRPETEVDLHSASLAQIAAALDRKASDTTMAELRGFREDDGATLRHIEAALDTLRFLQSQIIGEN